MISWYVQGIYYNIYANLQQASDASLCTTVTDKDDLEGQCFRDSVYLYLTINSIITPLLNRHFPEFLGSSTVWQNEIAMSSAPCTKVRFASFLSDGFTTMAAINPPERKLSKCTSVHCLKIMQGCRKNCTGIPALILKVKKNYQKITVC